MLVLALDTTTRVGSSAIVRDGRIVREEMSELERPHATRLPADLMAILARSDLRLDDVDLFAVTAGPGSFTGLRIGIATMQGLAFATQRPLIGVSALDALAEIGGGATVATWVDAWRGEVYASIYRHGVALDEPVVVSPTEALRSVVGPAVFIGDGAASHWSTISETLGARATLHEPATPPLAARVALMAARRHAAGIAPAPDAIRPIYVRRPDVELAREAGRGR